MEKCGYSPDDKLEGRQKKIFEYERKSLREKIAANLYNIKNWNKSNSSGVPPRFAECSFFNFECRNETEKSIFQKVCNFVSLEHNEGVLLMTGAKNTSGSCSSPGHTGPLCQHGRSDLQGGIQYELQISPDRRSF